MVASRAHNADPMTFTSVALNQLRLNQLDPDMFPALKYRLETERALSCALSLLLPVSYCLLPLPHHALPEIT